MIIEMKVEVKPREELEPVSVMGNNIIDEIDPKTHDKIVNNLGHDSYFLVLTCKNKPCVVTGNPFNEDTWKYHKHILEDIQ